MKYPKRTGITNAQWEGEGEDSEESTVTFGQVEVPSRKIMTYVDISNELLADSGGTAEAEVRRPKTSARRRLPPSSTAPDRRTPRAL